MRRRTVSKTRCLRASLLALALASIGASAQSTPALPLLPNGVAYDAAGNLYFADTDRHQVYESSLAGVLTIVAGSGVQGLTATPVPATSAQLNGPQGIAIGPDGTLYIADTGNQRIRVVVSGQIATFAGTGVAGFSGDNGSPLSATVSNPTALALDASGALLVCDTENHRVRRILAGVITTFAGSGIQGFAGDSAAATAAQLDTPSGISVGPDGRVYIADSHNNRVRVIATDGTITTFAGSSTQGYAGDNGLATSAQLSFPQGLVATASGTILFADSNNQRIRIVDAQGNITTIVGNGIQGTSSDGSSSATAALDTPRGISLSTFGSPVFSDTANHLVRESVSQSTLYLPAGLAPLRTTSASLSIPATTIYSQSMPTVAVSGTAGTPQGTVQLIDGTSLLAQAILVSGMASFASGSLATGSYQLSATYLGDGVNPAATSGTTIVNVTAASAIATANPITTEYGQTVPPLTGSLSGVLPQDIGEVTAVFATPAKPLSSPGTYPITVTLSGPASSNYVVELSPSSGSLQIDQAQSRTVELSLAQNSYEGLPLILTANVASTTQGTPTGSVTFSDGNLFIATATLTGGAASATYLSPAAGAHSIVASYLGDTDFTASTSSPVTTTVGAMPDFTLTASGNTTQTVTAGGLATYTLLIAAQPAPFTGAVSLSATGTPTGTMVTFSPTQTIPGTGSAAVTMNIQTAAPAASLHGSMRNSGILAGGMLLALPLLLRRRCCFLRAIGMLAFATVCMGTVACGARSITTAALAQQSYAVKVTGTGTNLAGVVVTHSATVTLIMQ